MNRMTDHAIESMPGCTRWSLDGLVQEVAAAKVSWNSSCRSVSSH